MLRQASFKICVFYDSSLLYLAVFEYISLSLCVFSGQVRLSSHVNQQEHVKQQEATKPCQIGKIVRFLHPKMLPFKKFSGLCPEPCWEGEGGGAQRPQTPPAKHLHSPLATPLLMVAAVVVVYSSGWCLFVLSVFSHHGDHCRFVSTLCTVPIRKKHYWTVKQRSLLPEIKTFSNENSFVRLRNRKVWNEKGSRYIISTTTTTKKGNIVQYPLGSKSND